MRHITFLVPAVILITVGNAVALPKTQAKQVTVDPSRISSTNTDVQAVLEDLDNSIPEQATTAISGIVRFATPAEVNAGTSSVVVVSAADLAAGTRAAGMCYSGAVVYSNSMPTAWADLNLSGIVGSNRCFVLLSVAPDTGGVVHFRENGETKYKAASSDKDSGIAGVGFGSGGEIGYITIITDSGGIIEWVSSSAGSGATVIKLLTYCILSD
jgi:hypothetical protein